MKIFVPPTLWYEDEAGDRLEGPAPGDYSPPAGAVYQVSQFPSTLHTTYLRLTEDGSSVVVARGSSSWWEELVLAMATAIPGALYQRRYRLSEAILIAATACERCMNALAWEYEVQGEDGRRQGYPEVGEEYRTAGTRCHFCDGQPPAPRNEAVPEGFVPPPVPDDIRGTDAVEPNGVYDHLERVR